MDQPLDDPLAELVRRLSRVEVEEPEQVDEQERNEKQQEHGHGARDAADGPGEPVERPDGEERDRRDVGEVDRAGDAPVHLLERGAEHRREEEGLTRRLSSRVALTSRRSREDDVTPHEQMLEPPARDPVEQPRLAPMRDRRLHAFDPVAGLVEQLLDPAPREEAQMRRVERPVRRVLPAAARDVEDVSPVADVRDRDDDGAGRIEQASVPHERRPRIDEMLEDVAVDDAVERRILERQLVPLDVGHDDLVEHAACLLGRSGIQLDARDVRDAERLQRCAEPAGSTTDVEQGLCPGWHERLDVGPLVGFELAPRAGGGPLRHEARLVVTDGAHSVEDGLRALHARVLRQELLPAGGCDRTRVPAQQVSRPFGELVDWSEDRLAPVDEVVGNDRSRRLGQQQRARVRDLPVPVRVIAEAADADGDPAPGEQLHVVRPREARGGRALDDGAVALELAEPCHDPARAPGWSGSRGMRRRRRAPPVGSKPVSMIAERERNDCT